MAKRIQQAVAIAALQRLQTLQAQFQLQHRMLVASHNPQCLQSFCKASFYTPFFNPYTEPESNLVMHLDSISPALEKYPVSAISGYYFSVSRFEEIFPQHANTYLVN